MNDDRYIKYGIRKNYFFKKGFYIYVGSALNNLEKRMERHLRINKKNYWHIDFLLNFGDITNIFYRGGDFKEECFIANLLKEIFLPISDFGSSDCKCKTHLFYGSKNKLLKFIIKNNMIEYSKQKT